MKKFSRLLLGVLISALLISAPVKGQRAISSAAENLIDSGLNYTESLDFVPNPGQGFYKAISYIMQPDREELPDELSEKGMGQWAGLYPLLHLHFGLESCSGNSYYERGGEYIKGTTQPITPEMLTAMRTAMTNVRELGFTAIIRFSYNVRGFAPGDVGAGGGGTYLQAEPPMTAILDHVEQLKPLFAEFKDVINSVDAGFLGPWGEMHTTTAATSVDNTNQLLNALLLAVPQERSVAIRYPLQYAQWYNAYYNKGWSGNSQLSQAFEQSRAPGTPESRISMFNDGYLGSSSDLGSFRIGRAAESPWISKASEFSSYGGEVVSNNGVTSGDGIGNYNKIEYIAWEGFITHTSYLNIDWNYQFVISKWMETPYRVGTLIGTYNNPVYPDGTTSAILDARYADANATAFTYVQNRLGYRLVVREASNTATVAAGGKVEFAGKIENVGFGNVTGSKRVQAIFAKKDGSQIYAADTDIDVREWKSMAGEVALNFSADMPAGAPDGVYDIYLKINNADEMYPETAVRTTRFANDDATMWNAELGANRVGTVTLGDAYYVTFQNSDGTFLGYSDAVSGGTAVYSGGTPVSPDVTVSTDYEFTGWDSSISNLTENKVVRAVYTPGVRQYTVSFYGHNDALIGTKKFGYGTELNAAMLQMDVPAWEEDIYLYTFDKWEGFEDGSVVTGDITLNAEYAQGYRNFSVTFNGYGGTLSNGSQTQSVKYGESAVSPTFVRQGYIFVGWTNSMSYIEVSGDTTVYAIWIPEYKTGDKDTGEEPGGGCSGGVTTPLAVLTAISAAMFTAARKKTLTR